MHIYLTVLKQLLYTLNSVQLFIYYLIVCMLICLFVCVFAHSFVSQLKCAQFVRGVQSD